MKKVFFYALLLFFINNSNAQIITTIAGNGVDAFMGDGGMATNAEINISASCSFDSIGNFYFLESEFNTRIRMINTAGIITTVAGNGTTGYTGDGGMATDAEIINSYGAKVDAIGNIYIADFANYRLRKVDAFTHRINTIAGTGVATSTGDGFAATLATLIPYDVCVDRNKNIYITDAGKIRKIDSFGIISTVAGNGVGGYSGDGGLATNAQISPFFICLDQEGNLLFSSGLKIRKVNLTTGIITFFAGTGIVLPFNGDGISADSANLRVWSLTCDARGNVYVGDDNNERVRKIDTSHIIHTIAGTGTGGYTCDNCLSTSSEISGPDGVAIDKCNNLYICDAQNARIRKVTYPTTYPTINLSVSPSDTICSGTSKTFNTTITGGYGGSATYQWYVNGTLTAATSSNYTYTPANGDSIRCVLTYSSPCSGTTVASSNTIYMVVDSYSVPSISVTAPVYATIGSIVTVNATVAGAGSSYNIHWYNRGVLFATTSVPMVSYTKVWGIDTITARVVSTSMGCYDSTLSTMHLVTDSTTEVVNALITNHTLTIYPNPAGRSINVGYAGIINNIVVSNLLGSVLIRQACNKSIEEVNIATLPSGVYFVKVNGVMWSRFVKE